MIHRTTLFFFLLFLFGCGSNEVRIPHQVSLNSSINSINEEDLLDVSIVLFESGVPEGEIDKELLEELINEGTCLLYTSPSPRD